MSTFLALALAAGTFGPPAPVSGRVEGLGLVAYEGQVAIRVSYSGRPGPVAVTRGGPLARVTLERTGLGWRFGAGRRFEWRPANSPERTFAVASSAIESLTVEQTRSETSLVFTLPPDVSLEVKQARSALLIVLRERGEPATLVAQAAPSPPPAAQAPPPPPSVPTPEPLPPPDTAPIPAAASTPAATPPPAPAAPPDLPPVVAPVPPVLPVLAPVLPEPVAVAEPAIPVPPAPEGRAEPGPEPSLAPTPAAELYRQLFPAASPEAETEAEAGDDTVALYARLFENRPPEQGAPSPEEMAAVERAPEREEGFPLGPFRLRPTFAASFVSADASLLSTPDTVHDRYFQLEPGITARAPVRDGAFTVEYAPSFRAAASFEATQAPTHVVTGSLDFPFGYDSIFSISDRFVISTLDTREVDPGGEYFFDLSQFRRNLLAANARLGLAPRFYLEVGGAFDHVAFDNPQGFFPYERRTVTAGLGYELTPTLRATVSYLHDEVPTPEDRPEAEASANGALLTLQGDLLPLLTGRLSVGFRDQANPNADQEGRRFQGLTLTGSLTRELSRSASLSLLANRATPVSNFEGNGFYVTTSLQVALSTALPGALTLDTGVAYGWNDYEVPALEIGVPREDRILSLYAGLRRTLGRQWWASVFYRQERRRSNLDLFDTTSDGFLVQVNWGLFGPRP